MLEVYLRETFGDGFDDHRYPNTTFYVESPWKGTELDVKQRLEIFGREEPRPLDMTLLCGYDDTSLAIGFNFTDIVKKDLRREGICVSKKEWLIKGLRELADLLENDESPVQ
jgi:hypothetical protein